MTPEQLQAIEDRAEKATAGPWEWSEALEDGWGHYGPDLISSRTRPKTGIGSRTPAPMVIQSWGHDADGLIISPTDAEFIAHAREDIPALVAEVRRLQAEVTHWQANHDAQVGHKQYVQGLFERTRSELQRTREALQEIASTSIPLAERNRGIVFENAKSMRQIAIVALLADELNTKEGE